MKCDCPQRSFGDGFHTRNCALVKAGVRVPKTVGRFNPEVHLRGGGTIRVEMQPSANGGWVLYEWYAQLERELMNAPAKKDVLKLLRAYRAGDYAADIDEVVDRISAAFSRCKQEREG